MQNALRDAQELRTALPSSPPTSDPAAERLLAILRAEYAYWRDQDEAAADDEPTDLACIRMGAMGAVANVMGAVLGHPAPWHPQPPAAAAAEKRHEPEDREI